MRIHLRHIKGVLTLGTILISKETAVYGSSSKSSSSNTVWPSSEAKPTNGSSSSSTKKRGLDQCKNNVDSATNHPECIVDIPRGGSSSSSSSTASVLIEAAAASSSTPYGIPLNGWKVILQLILTAMNVICWFVPLQNTKLTDNQLALSIANAFSGGVFLSLAFGHLIPECAHGFDQLASTSAATTLQNRGIDYKTLPYMVVLGGYLLIFFVEKVAFDTHDFAVSPETSTTTDDLNNSVSSNVSNKQQPVSGRSAVILLAALGKFIIIKS